MKKGAACAVAVLTAITPLSACTNQNSGQPTTSPSSGAPPGTERMGLPSLSLEEGRLLESQAGQDLLHPRLGQGPDPFPQAGLFDGRDLRDDHDALLG